MKPLTRLLRRLAQLERLIADKLDPPCLAIDPRCQERIVFDHIKGEVRREPVNTGRFSSL